MLHVVMTAALLTLLALDIANIFLVLRHRMAVPKSLAKRKLEAVLDATIWAPVGAVVTAAWLALNGGGTFDWFFLGWLVLTLPMDLRRLRDYQANKDNDWFDGPRQGLRRLARALSPRTVAA